MSSICLLLFSLFFLLFNLHASFLYCLYNYLLCLMFLFKYFILASSFSCHIPIRSSSYRSSFLFYISCPNISCAVSEIHFFILLPSWSVTEDSPCFTNLLIIKVKWSRYKPGASQRVGRGIALLFHDRGTRSGWVVSSTPRPHFTPGKDPVPILQEAGWAPGPVWTGGKSRPHWDSIPDRPARSQSLYRLSYRPIIFL